MVPELARAGQLAPYVAPDNLDQLDDVGSLSVGELLGSAGVTLRFTIDGPAGELVVPQVELRRTGEAFVAPNLEGTPLLLAGSGSVAPGAAFVLADLMGPGVVQSLQLQIPQLEPSILGSAPLSDTVRAHQDGTSQFQMTTGFSSKNHAWPAAATRLRLRRSCARPADSRRIVGWRGIGDVGDGSRQ